MSYHNPRYPHSWVTKSGNSVTVTNPALHEYHFNIVFPNGHLVEYDFYTDNRYGDNIPRVTNDPDNEYAAFLEAQVYWSQYER